MDGLCDLVFGIEAGHLQTGHQSIGLNRPTWIGA